MKRRNFGLLAGTSLLALMGPRNRAVAQAADASLLKTTLTPTGATRAGNAAGTIPAWTGGMTEIPAGINWDPESSLPPDFFAADAMLYEVNASNMAQYSELLSEGIQALIQRQGYSVQVYPTRRTAAAPQWVYDNAAQNVTRTTAEASGIRFGFNGAFGGVPFPIPDTDPLVAGAQIVWNHQARWGGSYRSSTVATYTVPNGQVTLVQAARNDFRYDYYAPNGSPATFDGYFYVTGGPGQFAPSTLAGGQIISKDSSNILRYPQDTWQLLAGQGRVRKAPEVEYDTPSSYADGIINYDEYFGFDGPMDRYDWKFIEKKEMLIPYNNNKTFHVDSVAAHKDKFFDPTITRWELHRVWVVEATLHQGERNVLARRRLYIDEDTWILGIVDAWDGNNNIFHCAYDFNAVFPNLPGTIFQNTIAYNLQTGDYVSLFGSYGNAPYNVAWKFDPVPDSVFLPQSMAAASAY